jgi:hypothetical protein
MKQRNPLKGWLLLLTPYYVTALVWLLIFGVHSSEYEYFLMMGAMVLNDGFRWLTGHPYDLMD